jgi:hypothetical protein
MGVLDIAIVGIALNAQNWVMVAVMSALGVVMAAIGVSAAVTRYELAGDRIRIAGGLARAQELAFTEISHVGTFTRPHKNVVLAAADGRQLVLGPRAIQDGPDFLRSVLERCRWAEFDPAVLAAYGLEVAEGAAQPAPGT